MYLPFSIFFPSDSLCVSVSDNRGSLCLRLSHILETSHFNEVGMKKLRGRLAGGLRGRERTPGVTMSAGQEDISVSERRGQLWTESQMGCVSDRTTGGRLGLNL